MNIKHGIYFPCLHYFFNMFTLIYLLEDKPEKSVLIFTGNKTLKIGNKLLSDPYAFA